VERPHPLGEQNYKCEICGRAFVLVTKNHGITEEQRVLIERLLLERISLRGICRAVGVGLRWLLHFMVARFAAAPVHLYIRPTAGIQRVILQCLEIEVAELWSYVGKKWNPQWVWIAMDTDHVGDRSRQSAHALWGKCPTGYQNTSHSILIVTKPRRVLFHQDNTDHHQARPSDQSRRTFQLHITATGLPARARHDIVLKEPCQSYRRHQVRYLRLQLHLMCSLAWIALPDATPGISPGQLHALARASETADV
jgi:hypothetical protein